MMRTRRDAGRRGGRAGAWCSAAWRWAAPPGGVQPGGPGAAPPRAATKAPVTLRLSWLTTKDEHTMAVHGPVFEQRLPHVRLQFEPAPDYLAKLAVMFNSDTIGDVMFLEADDEGYFGYWASQGS